MSTNASSGKPKLKRVLGLRELVIYGIILIQPTAAMPLYGEVSAKAHGHVVTTIILAMIAMLFTAISYGRMANAYPSAGSAYTYVGQELHPALGYLTGWSMVFDYVMNPIISVIFCGTTAMALFTTFSLPGMPSWAWKTFFAVLFTLLNLRGIKASARTNKWMAAGLMGVVVVFLVAAIRYIWFDADAVVGHFLRPVYDPELFSLKDVSAGAALAMTTYIGFDAISTLSEEAHNPRRNILLATVLTCVITAVLAGIQCYAAQLIAPGSVRFSDPVTAFAQIAERAGAAWPALVTSLHTAAWLGILVNAALLVAQTGSGSGAHLAAGRLLYGMGRDNAIPRSFFGALSPSTRIPRNNIILIGAVALIGSFFVDFGLGCEMLNFGALIGFMGVNIAAFVRYFIRSDKKTVLNFILPLLGFVICFYLWCHLKPRAQIVGSTWLLTGLVYGAWKTNWFRHKIEFAAPDEDEDDSPAATAQSE